MSKIKVFFSTLGNRLKITDEAIIKSLPFAGWLSFLALISIYLSHSADKKVHKIDNLSRKRQTLEAEHTETKERLTKLSLESRVITKAENLGLMQPEIRPEKIVITE
ncbi:FtsL-like putative cell division protein [Schleiferiaceae bacterium]|jgi:hypothetical protein|nr:hypothetical protein [Flavobacteriales bacterium]MDC1022108.1 FtsL-like putative cell division protein [Schleiferiaceae bacterium]|tara:strand:+ start:936 stop:1256 length:321 start_codon:yes stop_codon:yes gene_type:complete